MCACYASASSSLSSTTGATLSTSSGSGADSILFNKNIYNVYHTKNIQKTINPHGIDLSSGVEQSLGIKSNKKINNLFRLFYDN